MGTYSSNGGLLRCADKNGNIMPFKDTLSDTVGTSTSPLKCYYGYKSVKSPFEMTKYETFIRDTKTKQFSTTMRNPQHGTQPNSRSVKYWFPTIVYGDFKCDGNNGACYECASERCSGKKETTNKCTR
jgi:hypothetical protein